MKSMLKDTKVDKVYHTKGQKSIQVMHFYKGIDACISAKIMLLLYAKTTEVIMSRVCAICNKRPAAGRSIQRRGLAKKKGGVGRKITGISKRFFLPNLQKVRAIINKKVKRVYVCSKCLKAGKVQKV